MTFATDLLLAAWAFALGIRLLNVSSCRPGALWGWALLVTSAAALAGGLWHGFSPYWTQNLASYGWRGVLLLIGIADTLFGLAIVDYSLSGGWRNRLRWGIAVKAGLYFLLLMPVESFLLAVCDYLPTLLLILVLQFRSWQTDPSSRWLAAGVIAALIAAGVQVSGLQFHRHFNHNDLYHLLQAAALYLLYRGGRLFSVPQTV